MAASTHHSRRSVSTGVPPGPTRPPLSRVRRTTNRTSFGGGSGARARALLISGQPLFSSLHRAGVTVAYDMYQEIILQHYKAPKNFGRMDDPDLTGSESNPNCGDHLTFELKLDAERRAIEAVRFSGDGCAISIASASILTQKIAGRSLEEVRAITQDDVLKMVGIPLSPVRIKCALTGFAAFGRALHSGTPAADDAAVRSPGGTTST